MQLLHTEIEIPPLISQASEELQVGQVIHRPLAQLQRHTPYGVGVVAVFVDPVTRQQAQDCRF